MIFENVNYTPKAPIENASFRYYIKNIRVAQYKMLSFMAFIHYKAICIFTIGL